MPFMIGRICSLIKNAYQRIFLSLEKQARRAGVNMGEGNLIYSRFWSSEAYLISIGNYCQLTGGGKTTYSWRGSSRQI